MLAYGPWPGCFLCLVAQAAEGQASVRRLRQLRGSTTKQGPECFKSVVFPMVFTSDDGKSECASHNSRTDISGVQSTSLYRFCFELASIQANAHRLVLRRTTYIQSTFAARKAHSRERKPQFHSTTPQGGLLFLRDSPHLALNAGKCLSVPRTGVAEEFSQRSSLCMGVLGGLGLCQLSSASVEASAACAGGLGPCLRGPVGHMGVPRIEGPSLWVRKYTQTRPQGVLAS